MKSLVGQRYALSLLQAADAATENMIRADFETISATLSESRQLQSMLRSPVVKSADKAAVLRQIFEGKISPKTMQMLELLVRKGRGEFIPDVITEFNRLLDKRDGVIDVNVRSAVAMDGAEQLDLAKKLEAMTGKKVRLNVGVQQDLIGGFTARIGDTVIDGSIKQKLAQLRERFKTGALN
jgi:F-type H+-transporting ATPase subunit delta